MRGTKTTASPTNNLLRRSNFSYVLLFIGSDCVIKCWRVIIKFSQHLIKLGPIKTEQGKEGGIYRNSYI